MNLKRLSTMFLPNGNSPVPTRFPLLTLRLPIPNKNTVFYTGYLNALLLTILCIIVSLSTKLYSSKLDLYQNTVFYTGYVLLLTCLCIIANPCTKLYRSRSKLCKSNKKIIYNHVKSKFCIKIVKCKTIFGAPFSEYFNCIHVIDFNTFRSNTSNIVSKVMLSYMLDVIFLYAYINKQTFKAVYLANKYVHTALKSKCGHLTITTFTNVTFMQSHILHDMQIRFHRATLYTNVIMALVTSTSHRPSLQVHLVHFNHVYYTILLKNFTVIIRQVNVFIFRRLNIFHMCRAEYLKQND